MCQVVCKFSTIHFILHVSEYTDENECPENVILYVCLSSEEMNIGSGYVTLKGKLFFNIFIYFPSVNDRTL